MSLNEKKKKAIKLRQKGYSYGQIIKDLDLSSKGTLSNWFKDVVLSEKAKEKLKNNYELSAKRGLDKFNKKRSYDISEQNTQAIVEGKKEIAVSEKKELLILGASLYWGEGTKYIGKYPSLVFTNSDSEMIRMYMKFLRKGLCLDESKIKAGIHIHPYIKESEARRFWSKVSGLPENLFYIVNIISSASQGKRPRRRLPNGMIVIKVNRRQVFYRVIGMIEALKNI